MGDRENMALTIEEILAHGKKMGASDVHMTVGVPPKLRINGKVVTTDGPKIMPQDTLEMAAKLMNEKQKKHLNSAFLWWEGIEIRLCGKAIYLVVKQRVPDGSYYEIIVS